MAKKHPKLTDNDPMPFGRFAGQKMKDLPLEYVDYLLRQTWLRDWPHLSAWVESQRPRVEEHRPKITTPKELRSYEEYIKWGRL